MFMVQDLDMVKMIKAVVMVLVHATTTTTKTNTAGEPIVQVDVASLNMSVNSMAKSTQVGTRWLSRKYSAPNPNEKSTKIIDWKKLKTSGDKPTTKFTSLWIHSSKNCKKS